jgi:CheY-like chemotaxis protein
MEYLLIVVILFIAADLFIRFSLKGLKEKKEKRERAAALEEGLQIDYASEAKTLKRVEVDNPKARILCVDDEPVILDSFRKILVLEGYSIDTVEIGEEAIRLVRSNHYDFVFVDIKMPGMDGVEVTKQIKYIRPDIDVIIITGYASVETAVATMKHGAMDYVEKPFTEDELLAFTHKCFLTRSERIKRELGPKVQIAYLSEFENRSLGEFSIPGGVFISEGHCWIGLNEDGTAKIGVDDFANKMIGKVDDIEPPNLARTINRGDPLFSLKVGQRSIPFLSPVSGKITKVNTTLVEHPEHLEMSPYHDNWICLIDTDNIDNDVKELKIGKSAVIFIQDEIENCQTHFKTIAEQRKRDKKSSGLNGFSFGKIRELADKEWKQLINKFFER